MAQTNFTPIQLYRSNTPAAVPATADMAAGELAINYADGRLYYEKTGPAIAIIGAEMTSAIATFLGTPTSANLIAAVTNETGTGSLVFATSPTLVTPALGTPASGVMTNVTGTAASLTAGQATAALGIKTATTTVSVSGATAPSFGQALVATSSTDATWQTVLTSARLDLIGAATGTATIGNAAHDIVWNWQLASTSETGFAIGETAASTGGSGSQFLFDVGTLASSTADPFRVRARANNAISVGRTGAVSVTSTAGPSSAVGNALTLSSGAATSNTFAGGAVSITAGAGLTSGLGGAVNITSGAGGASAPPGDVVLSLGTYGGGTNGTIRLDATDTGVIEIEAGGAGTVDIGSADQTSVTSSSVRIYTGDCSAAFAGNVVITGGNSAGGTGGRVLLTAGNRSSAAGALVAITAGNTTSNTFAGGAVTLTAGNGLTTGVGGAVGITSGNGGASAIGGDVVITTGTGTTNGRVNFINTNVANGSVATTVTSLGPTGSATTIQGWLAIRIAGTDRYIPFW